MVKRATASVHSKSEASSLDRTVRYLSLWKAVWLISERLERAGRRVGFASASSQLKGELLASNLRANGDLVVAPRGWEPNFEEMDDQMGFPQGRRRRVTVPPSVWATEFNWRRSMAWDDFGEGVDFYSNIFVNEADIDKIWSPHTRRKSGPKRGSVPTFAQADKALIPNIQELMREKGLKLHAAVMTLVDAKQVKNRGGKDENIARRVERQFHKSMAAKKAKPTK